MLAQQSNSSADKGYMISINNNKQLPQYFGSKRFGDAVKTVVECIENRVVTVSKGADLKNVPINPEDIHIVNIESGELYRFKLADKVIKIVYPKNGTEVSANLLYGF